MSKTKERKKQETIETNRLQKQKNELVKEALALASRFVSRLLAKFADNHLEKKVIAFFIDELSSLPKKQLKKLKMESVKEEISIKVESSYPLTQAQKEALKKEVIKICGRAMPFEFQQSKALLAGLNVSIGSLVLKANLKDELNFFVEVANGSLPE